MQAKSQELIQFLEDERFQESRSIHRIFTGFSLVFLSFAALDWLIFPERFDEFLGLRLAYCLIPFGIFLFIGRTRSFLQTQLLALFHASVASGIITHMISQTGGVHSPYYAGLNLVGIIALCFFTFSAHFFWITAISIYLPYFLVVTSPFSGKPIELQELALNSFFMLGTLMVSSLIHYFRENFRKSYAEARLNLKHELTHRNEIIERKTQEAVRLNSLSSQFSPQIVESIREGKIQLQGENQRTRICSVFVDIVNSTDRVVRLPEWQVESVISKFLEDSAKIMLKYDVTIDKFLGDGVLGFCNAPLPRNDYISRTLRAALEIRHRVLSEQGTYSPLWGSPLQVRVGIATGDVNVGFFGSQKYFRTYTAIGPAVNLASRLCSSAAPNQILLSEEAANQVQDEFELKHIGSLKLKGFETLAVKAFELIDSKISVLQGAALGPSDCPQCGELLQVETNAQGHFVFVCRSCFSVIDMPMSVGPLTQAS